MVTLSLDTLLQYIRYFEEPEPGVPEGHTGWYHSYGKFKFHSPDQAFDRTGELKTPVRPEVAGPFSSREEALAHLKQNLEVQRKAG
jgi:hypothetical protein